MGGWHRSGGKQVGHKGYAAPVSGGGERGAEPAGAEACRCQTRASRCCSALTATGWRRTSGRKTKLRGFVPHVPTAVRPPPPHTEAASAMPTQHQRNQQNTQTGTPASRLVGSRDTRPPDSGSRGEPASAAAAAPPLPSTAAVAASGAACAAQASAKSSRGTAERLMTQIHADVARFGWCAAPGSGVFGG